MLETRIGHPRYEYAAVLTGLYEIEGESMLTFESRAAASHKAIVW